MKSRAALLATSLTLSAAASLLAQREASAFCGFYVGGGGAELFNNATQVVLMRDGTRTVLSMQNNYQGPPERFAMVVPVPVVLQKENVKTLKRDLFERLDKLDAPRLVEYWEQDPCMERQKPGDGLMPPPSPISAAPAARGAAADLGVKIEAQFTVGEYEIVILSAKDSVGLDTWLRREKYNIPAGAQPLLKPYVAQGMKFFVAKVDVSKVTFEDRGGEKMASLSPLRFHYDSESFSLPVRLGLVNSAGTQDLIVHILADKRFEVANYPNVTIPTNFDVDEKARDAFGNIYASLMDRTLEKNPKAVVTEYAWQATSCDPCPGPPLQGNDFASLGGDALPGADPDDPDVLPVPPVRRAPAPTLGGGGAAPGAPPPPPAMPAPPSMRMMMGNRFAQWTLTRLHARYGKDALGEDLIFRAAGPIQGGREMRNADGKLEHGSAVATYGGNNFQARYAIRHPWKGPIACSEPVRGVWGGPPAGESGTGGPRPATNLAFAKRDVQLASYVRSAVPELGISGGAAAQAPAAGSSDPTATVSATPTDGGATGPTPSKPRGCGGCTTSSRTPVPDTALAGMLAAVTAALLRRRRR